MIKALLRAVRSADVANLRSRAQGAIGRWATEYRQPAAIRRLAAAILLTVAAIGMGYLGSRALLSSKPEAIHVDADGQRLDLSTIAADDFVISPRFFTDPDYSVFRDANLENPVANGHVEIRFHGPLIDLSEALELRIAKSPWQKVLVDPKGVLFVPLKVRDVLQSGPVELQLLGPLESGKEKNVVDSFVYDCDVAATHKRHLASVFARTSGIEWLNDSIPKWYICPELNIGHWPIVRELRFGTSEASLDRFVEIRKSQLRPTFEVDERTGGIVPAPPHPTLAEEFESQITAMNNPGRLYAQLVFIDGSRSAVRLYDRSSTVADRVGRVGWFEPDRTGSWTLTQPMSMDPIAPEIKEIRLGVSEDRLSEVIVYQALTYPGQVRVVLDVPGQGLRSDTLAVMKRLGDPATIYAQVIFRSGDRSEIRNFSRDPSS